MFSSGYNLVGGNADQNWEIFLWDATGAVPRLVQITDSGNNPNAPYGAPANDDPWISRDGKIVVFSSWSDLTGDNLAGNREIFRADLCPPAAVRCGDGHVDVGEQCDDGPNNSDTESNACCTDCTLPRCGDNVVDDGDPYYEDCDDGNTVDGDDCPANCKLPMVLSPRLIIGKGLCGDSPQKIELREGGTNRDITSDPDIEYEWVHSYLEQDIACTFDDAALSKADSQCWPSDSTSLPALAAIGAGFQPTGSLHSFSGQPLSGQWQLNASDRAAGDVGSLLSWCLVPNTAAPTVSSFACNGGANCTLALGQASSLAATFADTNGNANHYTLAEYIGDSVLQQWSVGWVIEGDFAPTSGGTLPFDMSPFICQSQSCSTSYLALVMVISDSTGLQSPPAEVHITVLGTQ